MSLKGIIESLFEEAQKIENKSTADAAKVPVKDLSDPDWLAVAKKYNGLREIKGPKHNKDIQRWLKSLGLPWTDDETAWCGTFVGGTLIEAGKKEFVVKGPAGARNWLESGVKLNRPAYGCIVVFWRGSKSGWQGHVGYVVGIDQNGNLMVLGGNQSDAVNIKAFSKNRVLGYRWPGSAPYPERYKLPLYKSDGTVSENEA